MTDKRDYAGTLDFVKNLSQDTQSPLQVIFPEEFATIEHALKVAQAMQGDSDKSYDALKNWPCAGIGEDKVKEVMVFMNTYQTVLIKGLEAISGRTHGDAINEVLKEIDDDK